MTDPAERTAQLRALRFSVVQTKTFVDGDGNLAPRINTSAYRTMVGQLHDHAGDVNGFGLPWTDPDNHYWRHRYGREYMNTPAPILVAGLVPVRRKTQTSPIGPAGDTGVVPDLDVDALWLPTGIGTVLTGPIDMPSTPQAPPTFTAMAQTLDTAMSRRLPPPGDEIRDGAPVFHWWPDPAADGADPVPKTRTREPVRVISALLAPDGTQTALQMAAALATGFRGPSDKVGTQMLLAGSAVAVAGGNVGLVITDDSPDAARRLECLHHNLVTHLALMESMLGAVTVDAADIIARWYRDQGAMLLTHFHLATPDPASDTIYKTRLSQLWIDNSGVTASINTAAHDAQAPPEGSISPPQ